MIDSSADRLEGLRNYIFNNKRAPPDVPGARVRPRLPNKPGDATPDAPSVIPASSQRPGKRTNDTVPYARIVFTDFYDSPADPTDILPGDLVLVHRTSKSLGHDSNRASKVASWRQLNAHYSKKSAGVVLSAATAKAAIIRARQQALDGINDAFAETQRECIFVLERNMGTRTDISDRLRRIGNARDYLEKSLVAIQAPNAPVAFIPEFDWRGGCICGRLGPRRRVAV